MRDFLKKAKNFIPSSIIGRITIWYSLSLIFITVLTTNFLYWSLVKAVRAENDKFLLDRVQTISDLLEVESCSSNIELCENPVLSVKNRIEDEWSTRHFEKIFVKITDANKNILVLSPGAPQIVIKQVFPLSQKVFDEATKFESKKITTSDNRKYISISKIIISKNPKIGSLRIDLALDLENEEALLNQYKDKLILVLIITSLISLIIGILLAKIGFKPIQNIINITKRIRSTNLYERIEENTLPGELKQIGFTINMMLDNLQDSFARLSRFSSDIAHELRTPINNFRGEIEVALSRERSNEEYRDILQSSLEEIARITEIIEALLFLAQAENAVNEVDKKKIMLKIELEKIVDFYQASAEEEGISIEIHASDQMKIFAERTLLQRSIGNILSNAINYTPRGGKIGIACFEESEMAVIAISDNGSGIAQENISFVFDRFYRVDSARAPSKLGGFGLGLTIVKSIMKLHQGKIEIESTLNKGTTVKLLFPIA